VLVKARFAGANALHNAFFKSQRPQSVSLVCTGLRCNQFSKRTTSDRRNARRPHLTLPVKWFMSDLP
jgi:hypothetical protein